MIGVSGKKYNPKGANELKQINSTRNHLAVSGIGESFGILEPGLFDFCFEGGIILYGECLMVFGLWDLSVDLPLEGKNIQKTKS